MRLVKVVASWNPGEGGHWPVSLTWHLDPWGRVRRLALALALAFLAGCASAPAPAARTCAPASTERGGGQGVCAITTDGWILQGAAWNPDNPSAPSVMLVHGLNEDRHSYDALAHALAAKGYRVLAFDSRGMGLSTNLTDGSTRTLASFNQQDVLAMPHDMATMGASFQPTAIVGASVGANEAIAYAALSPGVRTVVLLSAGESYQGLDATAPAAKYGGSILFVASQGDTYAAGSAQDLASRHHGEHQVDVVGGSAHGTNLLADPTIQGAVVAWLGQHR
ncbi:MAG: hypothetical protein QOE90_155 [Thermoplasmata archaeon]|jgi:dienelactone hydrolase|nr:hypothetical protein [Thermoplasmata archaeon]